ncbi:tRNA uridine-5-carboxymethylaminomethyl(34) synthesis GTPase MnmE [Thermohalobaculum xanthum]|uniref:tRNA uridine-5-carboxymethylaminomethyl(34) synthesis GTPase MnmE n=1 Tax=Thermohalobaculum xanthum TaxID=2753746 RepID=UPI002D7FEE17|nr:tRNA uridine-5-carboxymethylaminomethyl(34) synthesis GTPase MnmE [Thermohalobaculum xanthum]
MSTGISDDGATIFALATPPGVGGIAVLRVSGPGADEALSRLTQRALPAPRQATLRRLRDAEGALLDEALVLRFAADASFTGEPVVEFHCHGGRAVVARLLDVLGGMAGLRPAEAGEFTRRAVLNGRLDLAEVEALGDLISAETERQRQLAAAGFGGALHRRAEAWRDRLLDILARVEITIDWADEEVPSDLDAELAQELDALAGEFDRELSASHGLERLREGFTVAILGAPNCGKSSFINYLAGREAAIASPHPGTTRDVIELRYDLRGLPVTFLDMAGLRETQDPVERIGVDRAVARGSAADLRLHFSAPDVADIALPGTLWREGDIGVRTKADLGAGSGDHAISVVTGEGIRPLLDAIHDRLSGRIPCDGVTSHARQRAALAAAREALCRARKQLSSGEPELIAEDLRGTLTELGRMVGRVGVEDMLDRVFSRFCVGK